MSSKEQTSLLVMSYLINTCEIPLQSIIKYPHFTDLADGTLPPAGSLEKQLVKAGRKVKTIKVPKKDPNEPKRPMSSFMLMSQKYRAKIKAKNPDATFGQLGKLIGEKWSTMEEDGESINQIFFCVEIQVFVNFLVLSRYSFILCRSLYTSW